MSSLATKRCGQPPEGSTPTRWPPSRRSRQSGVNEVPHLEQADPDLHLCDEEMRVPADLHQPSSPPIGPTSPTAPLSNVPQSPDSTTTTELPQSPSKTEGTASRKQVHALVVAASQDDTERDCWRCEGTGWPLSLGPPPGLSSPRTRSSSQPPHTPPIDPGPILSSLQSPTTPPAPPSSLPASHGSPHTVGVSPGSSSRTSSGRLVVVLMVSQGSLIPSKQDVAHSDSDRVRRKGRF